MLLFSGALRNWRKTRKGPDASASGSSVSEAHIKAVTVVKGAKTTRTTTAGGVGHAGAASNAPVPPPRREARASARSAKAPLKLHKVVELCATPSALAEGPASYEVVLSDGTDVSDPEEEGHKQQAHQQHQSHATANSKPRTDAAAPPPRRSRAPAPAAALSSTVLASVRRRTKQALPPAVASLAAIPPQRSVPAAAAAAAVAAGPGAVKAQAGQTRPRHGGNGWSEAVARLTSGAAARPVLTVLLLLAAGALMASGSQRLVTAFRQPVPRGSHRLGGSASPLTSFRPVAAAAAAAGSGSSPGRGARGAASASVWGTAAWIGGAMRLASSRSLAARAVPAPSTASATGSAPGMPGRNGGAALATRSGAGWWSAAAAVRGSGSGSSRSPVAAAAAAAADAAGGAAAAPEHSYEWRESAAVRVISIVSDAASPYRTSWDALAEHTAQRLEWTDPSYQMIVFRQDQLASKPDVQQAFMDAVGGGAHMLVGLDVSDAGVADFLQSSRVTSRLPGIVLFVGGVEALGRQLTRLPGGLRPQEPESWRTQLARKLTWTPDGAGLAVWDTVQLLLGRHDSDNFLFVFLVLVNQYVTTVRQVADTTKGFDLTSIICMIKNCGSKVVGCVQDPTCKTALDCLNGCTFNDQVCQYRCIVSYESPLLEQFSLCILQLHNCRNLDAKPPALPDPAPMTSFRGAALTHEAAEDLFIGWLDQPGQGAPAGQHLGQMPGKRYSWLVAAGKNPAYDYFPCQHQLYYRGKGRGQMWYEPIFKAITLDGREVWRRRVYRVRRAKVPGTFYLSVLDNGVTSNEYWRIVDCDENLDWCLFYYSGAASTAGLAYSGAVLGTPDGGMPGPQHTQRLHTALRRAGIEPWELSFVDNSKCADAPLQITGPTPAPVV
ncbi:hypothetical protein CHLRE_09g388060v5 [Chlamydomonas reinhardtii]|uniref:VDE lipocalin domain-containing protein n=1 Tax=Chlamydomonas reinhardtii TaxID=3055 RepID=A0A2K3DDX2_CHLRE|nr:uncharacterized protein CHLRE_09g388060v5 [Chlamydomonas reinhardtii]PNW78726.1 hypothetical protein CHLRE_09g388060v5 [Chlamydomonas reinhardtii]